MGIYRKIKETEDEAVEPWGTLCGQSHPKSTDQKGVCHGASLPQALPALSFTCPAQESNSTPKELPSQSSVYFLLGPKHAYGEPRTARVRARMNSGTAGTTFRDENLHVLHA